MDAAQDPTSAVFIGIVDFIALSSTVTLNGHGRTSDEPNDLSSEFIAYAAKCRRPVLDIGAAFGVATLPALEAGAHVIANDIEELHLRRILDRCPQRAQLRLQVVLGRFPDELNFGMASLGAILASNVLNFLSGREIEKGVALLRDWLAPGGKVFVICGTPYARNVRELIPEYELRASRGDPWPGEVHELQSKCPDPTIKELPPFLHLLDDRVLLRVFEAVGFVVESCYMYARPGLPEYLTFDARENVRLIARRP